MKNRQARQPVDSIEYLHAAATLACIRGGRRYRIDRSELSEAFYVKVFRPAGSPSPLDGAPASGSAPPNGDGEPGEVEKQSGAWWGTRVAAHQPVYRCSQDYAQIHVPREVADPAELDDAEQSLIAAIERGGRVVADPDEVREAMFEAFRGKRDGTERSGPAGARWRWREETLRWKLLSIDGVPAAEMPGDIRRAIAVFVPPDAPDVRLTPREQSEVRRRLNARARWTYEEQVAGRHSLPERRGGPGRAEAAER
ncbi:hypothetical protein [Alienimonas chondri]|uniref:Uncharacterized protein n=1 Tax=Alienimonas chondri TaxID=2681879 RepID=A0ABX1VF59_9PLAN|nr:hypothetical protein [Alienimonas chondri]NNJ26150.1 hypothetical protein [Alienimonas chondri]